MTKHNQNNKTAILLVEDDDLDAVSVKRALTKLNTNNPIYRAKDGLQGLELMRSELSGRPFVILLDLNMPKMNGLAMLKALREDPKLSHNIVYVLTTSNREQDKTSAYQHHIAGYFLKSTLNHDYSELGSMLNQYLQINEPPVQHAN
ncbi:response regulator [Thalassotalea hakodatensis]|uniref:response regulator n=1 Tax=Thalassotalea hakodatensis TaxID=3030492 RepID=UPI00257245A9|nr:response regulator [Thalassotalea hakodatensis]